MIDAERRLLKRLNTIPSVDSKLGILVSQDGPLATVNIGPNTLVIPYVGQYPAQIGESVQLERRDGELKATGPANTKSAAGVVVATGFPKLTVLSGGKVYELPYDPDAYLVPAIDDQVSVDWFYPGGRVSGRLSITPVVVPPATGGGSGAPSGRQTFTAQSSGSFAPGPIGSDDVIFGESYASAGWFYGSKIKDTIPDDAVINTFRIYLNCRTSSGAELQLGLHTLATKPGSSFPVTAKVTIPGISSGFSGWVDLIGIAGAWVNYLRANDGGIGTNGPGYRVLRGVSSDGQSGALDIGWN